MKRPIRKKVNVLEKNGDSISLDSIYIERCKKEGNVRSGKRRRFEGFC